MPYIKEEDRQRFQIGLDCVKRQCPKTAGELNYVITKIMHEYLNRNGKCYQTMNDIVGALEGAKLEFYRKVVSPYEDVKEQENPL